MNSGDYGFYDRHFTEDFIDEYPQSGEVLRGRENARWVLENYPRVNERERPVDQTVLRTQADQPAGYYFLVRVSSTAPLDRAEFQVDVILSGSPDAKTFRFTAAVPANETVFHLGVTGADWPGGKDESPLAWKLTLRDPAGRALAEQKSFLWEKPDGLRPSEK